jgi:hypothetical protein
MHRPSIPRALTRTATVAALAAAVTVPTLGSAPAFASSNHHWVYDSSYHSQRDCRDAGRSDSQHRHWFCDYDRYDSGNWWDLYYWE